MVRKCSHCGNVGHNSRTCINIEKEKVRGKLKLFGVEIDDGAYNYNSSSDSAAAALLKKSISLDCLPPNSSNSSEKSSSGYLSDAQIIKTHQRKKGVAWSEEEHKVFVIGLEKLGKGDWRGISRKFVTTRTPTQVASHAQKYFLRLNALNKTKQQRPSTTFHAAARDKFTMQVVEGNKSKLPTILPPSISFGIPSNATPIHNNISTSTILPLNNNNHHQNSQVPIRFGNEHHQPIKLLQNPTKSSSSISHLHGKQNKISHHQAPNLQLSLSNSTKPIVEQAESCCKSIAINGTISVT